MNRFRSGVAALMAALLMTSMVATAGAESYTPHHASQAIGCNQVDQALAGIPHGDGLRPVTDAELGPGGWRYNGDGQSFVTFAQTLTDGGYTSIAGRSNVGSNTGTINDYPHTLDIPQDFQSGELTFKGRSGKIILSGGDGFALPGGEVRVNVHDPDGDGVYVGCAQSPLLANAGFTVQEGGDFVQREYFKVYAETDDAGVVTYYEWTEVSTFKNTTPGGN